MCDALYQSAVEACLRPFRETDGLLPGTDERLADLLIPYWQGGQDAAIDFTVVNPLQAALVQKAAKEAQQWRRPIMIKYESIRRDAGRKVLRSSLLP